VSPAVTLDKWDHVNLGVVEWHLGLWKHVKGVLQGDVLWCPALLG
jgi:hypothetical protein